MGKEAIIQKIIKAVSSRLGYHLFRNNVGVAKVQGRFIRFGLAKGSSDLIGFKTHKITHDDVGKTIAVFTAIEVKSETGALSKEQKQWLDMVRAAGGIARVVSSVDDLME